MTKSVINNSNQLYDNALQQVLSTDVQSREQVRQKVVKRIQSKLPIDDILNVVQDGEVFRTKVYENIRRSVDRLRKRNQLVTTREGWAKVGSDRTNQQK